MRGEAPRINLSFLKQCQNELCKIGRSTDKPKSSGIEEELKGFARDFKSIYPEEIDMEGKSYLKTTVAEQMLSNILVDARTNFKSRVKKFIPSKLQDSINPKREAAKMTGLIFAGKWERVPSRVSALMRGVLPSEVQVSIV